MAREISKLITEQVLAKVVNEGIGGFSEVVTKFAGNYTKRRNVGFKVIESVVGGFNDTKNYYNAILSGREPVEMQEAVFFNQKE